MTHDVDLGAYLPLLGRIHDYLQPRTYLEIGVETGASLSLAGPGTWKIGIDPDPQLLHDFDPATTTVLKATSDGFFASPVSRALFRGQPIDLAFLDGMHLFEYTLRDFINVERRCRPGSAIVVHDCLPIDPVTAARERTTAVWTGDVWKLVVCLRRYRPDLHLVVTDVEPSGLAIVTGLDPTSTVLAANMAEIVAEFMPLEYEDIAGDVAPRLRVVGSAWEDVESHLPAPFPALSEPVRPLVVLAELAEIRDEPAILLAWAAAGRGLRGVTLAIYARGEDPAAAAEVVERQLADGASSGRESSDDIDVAIIPVGVHDEDDWTLLQGSDLALSERGLPGRLSLLPRLGMVDLPVLAAVHGACA